jgi:hypothetical protein
MKEQPMKKPITFALEVWDRHIGRLNTKKKCMCIKSISFTDTD